MKLNILKGLTQHRILPSSTSEAGPPIVLEIWHWLHSGSSALATHKMFISSEIVFHVQFCYMPSFARESAYNSLGPSHHCPQPCSIQDN